MSEKPYHLFSSHLKQRFGDRVHKISVDAGFSCPNRGATRQGPGCVFCDPSGSGSVGIENSLSVAAQIEAGKEVMIRKYKARHFLAYFQPFSNTFAPVERLRQLYDEALSVEGVVGMAVGTRPDCLPAPVLDLLAEYHQRSYFWLELGLQSIHDQTLERLRRGHDYATFLKAYDEAKKRGLQICVHLMIGLPGESRQQILASAEAMARLGVDGIKLHLLHVLDGTELGTLYRQGQLDMLSQEDYVSLVVDMVERLAPHTLIHRLTGDGPRQKLLAPLWSLNKWQVLNAIDGEFRKRATTQGSRFAGTADGTDSP